MDTDRVFIPRIRPAGSDPIPAPAHLLNGFFIRAQTRPAGLHGPRGHRLAQPDLGPIRNPNLGPTEKKNLN